jgi:hypothetical protein
MFIVIKTTVGRTELMVAGLGDEPPLVLWVVLVDCGKLGDVISIEAIDRRTGLVVVVVFEELLVVLGVTVLNSRFCGKLDDVYYH